MLYFIFLDIKLSQKTHYVLTLAVSLCQHWLNAYAFTSVSYETDYALLADFLVTCYVSYLRRLNTFCDWLFACASIAVPAC